MKYFIITILLLNTVLITLSQEKEEIIISNNKFSFDLYQKLNSKENNVVFSPSSIVSAMAMTYIGSKNNTLNEISNTFYFSKDINKFSQDYHNLIYQTQSKDNLKFYSANSIWIQDGLTLKQDFVDLNRLYYSSLMNQVDFINYPDKARNTINSWVEKSTNQKILNLLPESVIDNSTRLVLVNAIYFKGSWKSKFIKDQNTQEAFQVGKKTFVQKEFMNKAISSYYFSNKYAHMFELPYTDHNISLLIILPKSFKKIKKLEKSLNNEMYQDYIENKKHYRVSLSIPKFSYESDFDLNKTLYKLGIKDAFTSAADFSGITESERLYISNVIHKANISIDEEGTEAAAATAVTMRKTSMLLEEINIKVDKPFIFILKNNKTNCIYFMGKVINPN